MTIRKPRLSLAAGLFALAVWPAPADAAMCSSRDTVTKLLKSRYNEAPRAVGMVSDRGVMELYVAPATATWTVVVTTPRGQTCILAAGQGFELVEPLLADLPGEDS